MPRIDLTLQDRDVTVFAGASNTWYQRSRPVSAAFSCPHFVGSPAEYNSLTANRWGRTDTLFEAPGTRVPKELNDDSGQAPAPKQSIRTTDTPHRSP